MHLNYEIIVLLKGIYTIAKVEIMNY